MPTTLRSLDLQWILFRRVAASLRETLNVPLRTLRSLREISILPRMKTLANALVSSALLLPFATFADADPGRAAFREIYEEMVEIDSSPTTGSCTKLVRAAEARLKAAGYGPGEVEL